MISFSRFLAAASALCVAIILRPEPARAQSFGTHTRAVDTAPVDAAAGTDRQVVRLGVFD